MTRRLALSLGAAITGLVAITFSLTLFTVQQAANKGTEVHIGLTSSLSRRLESGYVEIEILAPSTLLALSGAGGEDQRGRGFSGEAGLRKASLVVGPWSLAKHSE